MRFLLLAKEERVSRLQQVGRWLDALHQDQEPHQRVLTNTKKNLVKNDVIQAMAEAGVLVHRLANGCKQCEE